MNLFSRVKDWGYKAGVFEEDDKNLQANKLISEAYEVCTRIVYEGTDDITEEIGKCLLQLNILCHMTQNNPDDCLSLALNKVEKRKDKPEATDEPIPM